MVEELSLPRDVIVPLGRAFMDARGAIIPLVDLPMRSALIITSHASSVRGNHYHRTDWHFCYVISGVIEYFHRPAGSNMPPERVMVHAGQMFFTPALVEHAMRFPEETTFLTLGRNPRDQSSYEADLVRVSLVPQP